MCTYNNRIKDLKVQVPRLLEKTQNWCFPKKHIKENIKLKLDQKEFKWKSIWKDQAFSVIKKRRRLQWLGHLLRLNPETPAIISLEECLTPDKLYRGRPKIIWLPVIKEDFKNEYLSQDIRDIFEKITI